jgi:hypothetical protein
MPASSARSSSSFRDRTRNRVNNGYVGSIILGVPLARLSYGANPRHLRSGMLHRTFFASTIAIANTRMAAPSQTHLQIFCSMGILTGSPSGPGAHRPFNPLNVKSCGKSGFFFVVPQMAQNPSDGCFPVPLHAVYINVLIIIPIKLSYSVECR